MTLYWRWNTTPTQVYSRTHDDFYALLEHARLFRWAEWYISEGDKMLACSKGWTPELAKKAKG